MACPSCGYDEGPGVTCPRCGVAMAGPPTQDRADVQRLVDEAGPLELDAKYLAERDAKRRPPRSSAPWVIAMVVVVGAAIGGFALFTRRSHEAAAPQPPRAGVSIRIVASQPVDITIDGARAGRTPITLNRPRGTKAIVIAAPALAVARDVVPDRDQTIDLGP